MKPLTTPNFIPSSEELSKLDRDLRFHPSTTERPAALTPEQIVAFNRDGYLAGIRIFDEGEIAGIRGYFDELLARTLATGGDSYSISTAHLRHRRVYDILTDPRIVARIKDLIGRTWLLGFTFLLQNAWGWQTGFVAPDSSYWPLTPSMAVTAWLAIDDARVENACMRYIPGSHHLGHLTYTLSENDEADARTRLFRILNLGRPVDDELKAGEISIHSDLLLHGSEANQSSKRRCGLLCAIARLS